MNYWQFYSFFIKEVSWASRRRVYARELCAGIRIESARAQKGTTWNAHTMWLQLQAICARVDAFVLHSFNIIFLEQMQHLWPI